MIVLFTDFGFNGPYLGQMKAVIWQQAPELPIIDLFADAPVHNPHASAYLLASYSEAFPEGTVFLAVVDPGVGSPQREPAIIQASKRWYVGPDNGLFNVIATHHPDLQAWHVRWQPEQLSASFHGRDLFAPLAVKLAKGEQLPETAVAETDLEKWPADLNEVIYIDHFGNLITGIRAVSLPEGGSLSIDEMPIPRVRTFSDVPPGVPLCYENANGLLEIAVNQGSAADYFRVAIGESVYVLA